MFNRCTATSGGDDLPRPLTRTKLIEMLQEQIRDDPHLFFLDKNNYQEMVDVLAASFKEDPLMKWTAGLDVTLEQEKKEKLQLKSNSFLQGWVNWPIVFLKKGVVLGVKANEHDGRLVGAMSLMPGKNSNDGFIDNFLNMIFVGIPPFYTKEKENYGPMAGKRLESMEVLPRKRKELMRVSNSNFVYIQAIGVLHSHQGKGLGAKLLRSILKAADTFDVNLYLETESKENESMYQHFGFETTEIIELAAEGTPAKQPMWLMIRRPK